MRCERQLKQPQAEQVLSHLKKKKPSVLSLFPPVSSENELFGGGLSYKGVLQMGL